MPQISKRILRKNVSQEIFDLFWESITQLRNKKRTRHFLESLLTKTEKQILAKRVAVAFLLKKGCRYEMISNLLGISSSTISSVQERLNNPGFDQIIKELIANKKIDKFMLKLGEKITGFLAGGKGGSNWYEASKSYHDELKDKIF